METTQLQLTGLTCVACQKVSQKIISTIEGVEDVKVELDGDVVIKANRKIRPEEVDKALEATHYRVKKS